MPSKKKPTKKSLKITQFHIEANGDVAWALDASGRLYRSHIGASPENPNHVQLDRWVEVTEATEVTE